MHSALESTADAFRPKAWSPSGGFVSAFRPRVVPRFFSEARKEFGSEQSGCAVAITLQMQEPGNSYQALRNLPSRSQVLEVALVELLEAILELWYVVVSVAFEVFCGIPAV